MTTLLFFFLAQPRDNRHADTLETEGATSDNVVEDGPGPKDDDVAAGNEEGTSTPSSTFTTSIRETPDHTVYFFFFLLNADTRDAGTGEAGGNPLVRVGEDGPGRKGTNESAADEDVTTTPNRTLPQRLAQQLTIPYISSYYPFVQTTGGPIPRQSRRRLQIQTYCDRPYPPPTLNSRLRHLRDPLTIRSRDETGKRGMNFEVPYPRVVFAGDSGDWT